MKSAVLRSLVLGMAAIAAGGMSFGQQAKAPAAVAAHDAKDVTGDWQGTLKLPQTSLRLVLKITKGEKGLAVRFFSIDQAQAPPMNSSSASLEGNSVKFAIELIAATYEGTVNSDGSLIAGTWKQGASLVAPLDFVRATKETAWEIPAPPAPRKVMAADANPTFEVATIKPSAPDVNSMKALYVDGRNFKTVGSSLGDLISFAYDVQMKQLVNTPDWLNKDRYDIDGVPDVEGDPNTLQLRVMVRKLLTERYKLTFHKEKRDLNAFVLSIAKGGSKLTETEVKGSLPGMGMRPAPGGLQLIFRNGTLAELGSFMQSLILDRPVVDQTGLTKKYDLTIKFTPDDSLFNGHPPPVQKSDSVEAFPSLFDAMQQQLGLKLEAQKTAVDVIAIDHVEKPSAN